MKYVYKSFDDSYISKYGEISSGYVEAKKSKFNCYIFKIETISNVEDYINKIRVDNKTARHIVYVYSFLDSNHNQILKYNEDHELQGAALKEIIAIINKQNITNILIVIVRYFGNILLGKGLLSKCYKNSFKNAVKSNLNKIKLHEYTILEINIKYSYLNNVLNFIKNYLKDNADPEIVIVDMKYLDYIYLKLKIQSEIYDEFNRNLNILLNN